jgi:hypothetical protein
MQFWVSFQHRKSLTILIVSVMGLLFVLSCRTMVPGIRESDIEHEDVLDGEGVSIPTVTIEKVTPPSIPAINFSFEDASTVLPEDILDEVGYFTGGGQMTFLTCEKSSMMEFCFVTDEVRWLESFIAHIQGVDFGDEINVLVDVPNGQKIESFVTVPLSEVPVLEYRFALTPEMPIGRYKIIFSGKNGVLEHEFNVNMPSEPVVRERGNKIILLGFKPDENVRFFVYQYQPKLSRIAFIAWKTLIIGAEGTLIIDIEFSEGKSVEDFMYFIVNDDDEILYDSLFDIFSGGSLFSSNTIPEPVQICSGMRSRLYNALNAQVAQLNGSNVRIRSRPGFSHDIVASISTGTKVMIVELSPVCADESTWWEIQTEDGIKGWMAESQNGVYLLEPYP